MLITRIKLARKTGALTLLVMSAQLLTLPLAMATGTGLLPVPVYTGGLAERSYLLGDLDGNRTDWANNGTSFDISYNQYYQGVTNGGLDNDSEYGGTINYNVNIDFDKMGLISGGLLQLRARSRYGKSVNGISGSIVPVNTDATLLTASSPDENIALWLPVINYTQFLSQTFALSLGKFDTLDSSNEFAGGRGRTQWWNQNLNMPVSPLLVAPNVTTGIVATYIPSPNLVFTGMVSTITDTSNSSGFDNFDDGLVAMGMLSYQYQVDSLPGGLVFMPGYGWDRDFAELNGRLNINDGQVILEKADSTWFTSLSFWQYLWTKDNTAKQAIDLSDGRQDLEGVGVFLRVQTADKDTNPMDYSIAGGINAKGLFINRNNDAMGLAYVYNKLPDDGILNVAGLEAQSSAWELFYNLEVTPAVHVTFNAQSVKSAFSKVDRATVLGLSLELIL